MHLGTCWSKSLNFGKKNLKSFFFFSLKKKKKRKGLIPSEGNQRVSCLLNCPCCVIQKALQPSFWRRESCQFTVKSQTPFQKNTRKTCRSPSPLPVPLFPLPEKYNFVKHLDVDGTSFSNGKKAPPRSELPRGMPCQGVGGSSSPLRLRRCLQTPGTGRQREEAGALMS